MANYVSGNIISQSYVHVNPEWLKNATAQDKKLRINEIEKQITAFAKSRIPFFIGSEVEITVEFSEGSIIAKITAYGKIIPLLGGLVIGYPHFSEGVRTMVKDAHDLGSYINSELLFQTGAKHKSERKSVEARLGVFGIIDRVNAQINDLSLISTRKENSPSITYKKLLQLHGDILSSLDKISENALDDSDEKIAKDMWIEGVSGISVGRSHFKFNLTGDDDVYKMLVAEKQSILDDLKKRQ